MAASTPMTQSGTGRGPAPPLPEKPPSVAERTRLLKSSFRKDDVDKPKVVSSSPIVERAATLPHTGSHETNGDKSETPSPASSVGSMTGVGVKASTPDSVKDLPPKPAVSPPAVCIFVCLVFNCACSHIHSGKGWVPGYEVPVHMYLQTYFYLNVCFFSLLHIF